MATRYKLKEFARITNLTRKALLVYQKKGLLEPDIVDEKNGYRYYSDEQLQRASLLSLFRNIEIPLIDAKKILESNVTIGDYLEKSGKKIELTKQLIKTRHALQLVELCEKKNQELFSKGVTLGTFGPHTVVSIEVRSDRYGVLNCMAHFKKQLLQSGVKQSAPSFCFFYAESDCSTFHSKVCIPVENGVVIEDKNCKKEVIGVSKVASVNHFGDPAAIDISYQKLGSLLKERNLNTTGEYIESYLIYSDNQYIDTSTFITRVSAVLV